jgi:hypothetical protein
MSINSGIYLQDLQGGFMCERGIFSGGFMENCQDSDLDLGVTKNPKGLDVKQPGPSSSSGHQHRTAQVAPLAGGSST